MTAVAYSIVVIACDWKQDLTTSLLENPGKTILRRSLILRCF